MKLPLVILAGLLLAAPVFGQTPPDPRQQAIARAMEADRAKMEGGLTRFDLDFPGGTPAQLVAAIEQATGRPLNAIIPPEHADRQLPPLRMNNVNVAELFHALLDASETKLRTSHQWLDYNTGFVTKAQRASDDSIWFFKLVGTDPRLVPAPAPKPVRYFLLTPYLQQGLTVDDITTAIQTGWRMRGEAGQAEISFHQETKLLIAVGEAEQLQVIDAVLEALRTPVPSASGPLIIGGSNETSMRPAPAAPPPPAPVAPKS